jgi:hypothetical protein
MSSTADRSATVMDSDKCRPLGRHDHSGRKRSSSPAARDEQEMGGAIHEL